MKLYANRSRPAWYVLLFVLAAMSATLFALDTWLPDAQTQYAMVQESE
jgi:formate hydrogenlyase subunit 3/multisubunit Na+/H+ antiporter MnhD subunit